MIQLIRSLLLIVCVVILARSINADVQLDPASVQVFLDQVFGSPEGYARSIGFKGATAAVFTRDGTIIAQGGWSRDGNSLDPASAIFSACEVSKIITATAAMILVDRGQLDLHADINSYFQTPIIKPVVIGRDGDNFLSQPESNATGPVTAYHLLTQTGGLGNYAPFSSLTPNPRLLERAAQNPFRLSRYFEMMPPYRIQNPGDFVMGISAHSTLLGHVTEVVAGQPLDRFIEQNIFAPLGMTSTFPFGNTTLLQNPNLQPGTTPPQIPLDWPNIGMYSTVTDLVKLGAMHLNGGVYKGVRILSEASVQLMQTPQFYQSQLLPPMGLGWRFARSGLDNGSSPFIEMYGSVSDLIGYIGFLRIYPEEGVGFVFLASDAPLFPDAAAHRASGFGSLFHNRFIAPFSCQLPNMALDPAAGCVVNTSYFSRRVESNPDVIGRYINANIAQLSWFKFNGYLKGILRISLNADGLLEFSELGLCIYEVDDLLFYIGFRGLYPGGGADTCGWFYPYASELLFTARLQNDTFGEYSAPIIYTYLVTPTQYYPPLPPAFRLSWMPIFVIFLILFGVTWIVVGANVVVIYLRRKRARILAIKQKTAAVGADFRLKPIGENTLDRSLLPRPASASVKFRIKREARWTTFASIGAMVLMMVVAVMNFSTLVSALIGISNPPEGGLEVVLRVQLSLCLLAAVLVIPMIALAVPVMLFSEWHGLAKIWYLCFTLASAYFILILMEWNWFGPFYVE